MGTITCTLANGAKVDMIATNSISSGQIAADVTLRDKTLVQAQAQVDQLAASMASALSDTTTAGTAVAGPPAGFSLDVSKVLPGNTISLTYTDTATNTQHQLSIVDVTDPGALPLQNAPNANPKQIGIDFSGGMASIVAQLNTALGGSNLQFSNPSGSLLQVTDNGTNSATVNAASVTTTASSLADGNLADPGVYRREFALHRRDHGDRRPADRAGGAHHGQRRAARRSLEIHDLQHLAPDQCRRHLAPRFSLFATDVSHLHLLAPDRARHHHGAVQGNAEQLHAAVPEPAGQRVDLGDPAPAGTGRRRQHAAAENEFHSGVNIDTEMANLISIQNNYAANAHVMSVVQTMMNSLMQAQCKAIDMAINGITYGASSVLNQSC